LRPPIDYGGWSQYTCVETLEATHLNCSFTFADVDGVQWLVEGDFMWQSAFDTLSGMWIDHKFIAFGDYDITLSRYVE